MPYLCLCANVGVIVCVMPLNIQIDNFLGDFLMFVVVWAYKIIARFVFYSFHLCVCLWEILCCRDFIQISFIIHLFKHVIIYLFYCVRFF